MGTLRRKWDDLRGSKYPWGERLPQEAAGCAFDDALEHAIRAWKDPRLENVAPRFHSKTRKAAFRIDDRDNRVRCQGQYIELPRIGKVPMRESLRLPGTLCKVPSSERPAAGSPA